MRRGIQDMLAHGGCEIFWEQIMHHLAHHAGFCGQNADEKPIEALASLAGAAGLQKKSTTQEQAESKFRPFSLRVIGLLDQYGQHHHHIKCHDKSNIARERVSTTKHHHATKRKQPAIFRPQKNGGIARDADPPH